ncbi:outer membrane protein [Sphingomonas koreensis]
MKIKFLLCSLALAAAGTAQAKDGSDKAFDGFKVGVSAGISRTSIEKPVAGEKTELDVAKKSFDWRGYLGYDIQTDSNIVLGVELGLGGGGKSFSQKVGTTNVKADPGRTFDAAARLGYAVNNTVLVFGKAGWARQHFDLTATAGAVGAKPVTTKIKENGFLYGAGAEVALSPSFAIRGEFDRVKFSDDVKRDRFLLGGVMRF